MPATGYSRTPKLLQGALIYFGATMIIPVPNIIVFQYNPESMTRTLTPWQPLKAFVPRFDKEGKLINEEELKSYTEQLANLAQPYDPQEQFSLVLEVDATDALEHPETHPVAVLTGVADRLAAIEMLMYPPGESLLGGLLGSVSASVSVSAEGGVSASVTVGDVSPVVMRKEVPIVLFFWGPGRIVPVRITTLSIEEQQFSPLLYPLRAKATLGVKVLSLRDLVTAEGNPATGFAVDLAEGCYKFTRAQKQALALANLANAAESIIGMLPI
jgi:hypothetical protein